MQHVGHRRSDNIAQLNGQCPFTVLYEDGNKYEIVKVTEEAPGHTAYWYQTPNGISHLLWAKSSQIVEEAPVVKKKRGRPKKVS